MARQFAKMYCELLRTREFLDLTPEARWTWAFIRMQEDLNQAGIITIRLTAWAKGLGYSRETVVNAVNELAVTEFVIADWDEEKLLQRRFIITDEVYRTPNSMIAADRAIRDCRSGPVLAALYWEMRELITQVPEMMIKKGLSRPPRQVVMELIGHLEGYAYPSATPLGPPAMGSVGVREPVQLGSGMSSPTVPLFIAGDPQIGPEQDIPMGTERVPSLTSLVQVVGKDLDVKRQTSDKTGGADGPDFDPPHGGAPAPSAAHAAALTLDAAADFPESTPPAEGAYQQGGKLYPRNGQGLMALWIDHCSAPPLDRVRGHVAGEIGKLLEEGIPWDDIRRGLAQWHMKRQNAATIPSFVHAVRQGPPEDTRRPRAGQAAAITPPTTEREMSL